VVGEFGDFLGAADAGRGGEAHQHLVLHISDPVRRMQSSPSRIVSRTKARAERSLASFSANRWCMTGCPPACATCARLLGLRQRSEFVHHAAGDTDGDAGETGGVGAGGAEAEERVVDAAFLVDVAADGVGFGNEDAGRDGVAVAAVPRRPTTSQFLVQMSSSWRNSMVRSIGAPLASFSSEPSGSSTWQWQPIQWRGGHHCQNPFAGDL